MQKAKSVHFVSIHGQEFKRLILCDGYTASELERNLEIFRESKIFPSIVIRYERELWVDFIEGETLKADDSSVVEKIADFYSRLYSEAPRCVDTNSTLFPDRLDRDLHFLCRVGILEEKSLEELKRSAKILQPKHCWVGFDYTDPVRKNFVLIPGTQTLCAVDIEGLVRDHLIGMGAAKALVRWLNPYKDDFFTLLASKNVPDVQPYYGFIELCFLAQWMKRAFFERDWKAIKPDYFHKYQR